MNQSEIERRTPLQANPDKPLKRKGRIKPVSVKRSAEGAAVKSAAARRRLPRVSKKRAAQNRERAAMADHLWPDRREGTVMCGCGRTECRRRADDLHEPRFRSRLGSTVDPENAIPVSRDCHDWIHAHPEEARELGLAVHSWE